MFLPRNVMLLKNTSEQMALVQFSYLPIQHILSTIVTVVAKNVNVTRLLISIVTIVCSLIIRRQKNWTRESM